MSRPTAGSQRPLTLTEELERLEQSITLTLQEIDHNFSRAHRIVTSSILPIVEQYANHSRDVWEGSKFWKQFFEASANVSLSGYEEQQSTAGDQDTTEDSNATTHTTLETSESYDTPNAQHVSTDSMQDIDLSNLTISPSHSTPRQPKPKQRRGERSPYKTLKQDVDESNVDVTYADDPRTPSKQTSSLLDDVAMTPEQSPEMPRRQVSLARPSTTKKQDPLLHTVLDKNYRIQATPLADNRTRRAARTPITANRGRLDSTLESSPLAPPELHAEVFDSPVRREITQNLNQQRTPGVSVLTPGRRKARERDVWDSDDDEIIDEATGMPYGASPPKTMQFHVPQSRLLKTPAREASKQIVDNILASAGVQRNEEYSEDFEIDLDLDYEEADSPSVVQKTPLEDETF